MNQERKTVFAEALAAHAVTQYLHYVDALVALYAFVKARTKPYSYLQFAADLGIGANNSLRLVLIGRRRLTRKKAITIAAALSLAGMDRRYWLALVDFCNARNVAEREACFERLKQLKSEHLPTPLDRSRLEFFSEWYYPVIWELAARQDFELDPKWIQRQIAFVLRVEEIKKAIEVLSRLGLIHYDAAKNRFVRALQQIDTGADARGLAFAGYHQQMIELAKRSVTQLPKDRREVTCATVSIPQEKFEQLRKKIRGLVRDAVAGQSEVAGVGDAVVQLNVQLFAVTINQPVQLKPKEDV